MRIEHIAMYVRDLEAAKAFFTRYLEATSGGEYHNESTGFRSYFLSFADGARLELMTRPSMIELPKDHMRTGLAHMAFSVGSREAVDRLTNELRADGYQVLSGPRTTGDGYYESCIVAIEGNVIEIVA